MAYKGIGKSSGEDAIGLGSEAWNIADGYTKIKILRLLIQLDIDEEIALFGRKDKQDYIPNEVIPQRRIEHYKKFIFHLKQLVGNCKFAIEKGVDEMIINQILTRIENVEKVSDGIHTFISNDVTKEDELVINEDHFLTCMNILQKIKEELNFPVNRAGLIFRQGDTLDLDAIMRQIEEGG